MSAPLVSVVLSVKNGMPFLPEAVESILAQEFSPFECLILNNASTDATWQYLQGLDDSRVRIVDNGQDLGIAGSRNKAFTLARAAYIAPMDADDKALPHRLAVQFTHMNGNSRLVASCGQMVSYETGEAITANGNADCACLFGSPLFHSCSIMRKDAVLDICGGYPLGQSPSEDYGLWAEIMMSGLGRLDTVPDVLLRYRTHPGKVRMSHHSAMVEQKNKILDRLCAWFWQDAYQEGYAALHRQCNDDMPFVSWRRLEEIVGYTLDLVEHNEKQHIFDPRELQARVLSQWERMCHRIPMSALASVAWHCKRLTSLRIGESSFGAILLATLNQRARHKLSTALGHFF